MINNYMSNLKYEKYLKNSNLKEFIIVITYLPLRRRYTIQFLLLTGKIINKLMNSPVVSFGLYANFTRSYYVTVSVWESRDSMHDFISTLPHSTAMKNFDKWKSNEGKFIEYQSISSAIDWKKVKQELKIDI